MRKIKVSAHARKGKKVRQHDRQLEKGITKKEGKELSAKKIETNDLRCPGGMCAEMAKGLMDEHASGNAVMNVEGATEYVHRGLKNSLAPQEFKKWVGSKKRVRAHVLAKYGSIFGDNKMWSNE